MNARVSFTVPGPPSTWERTAGQRKNTTKHNKAKDAIALRALVAMRLAGLRAFKGPVKLSLLAVYQRNLECPEWTTKEAWATGLRLYKPTTPDVDNCAKIFADGLQPKKGRHGKGRPFCLDDDARVCVLHAVKVIAAVGEKPHTVVTVEELGAAWTPST